MVYESDRKGAKEVFENSSVINVKDRGKDQDMYINSKELFPCNNCGLRAEFIQQLNCGSIVSLRCGCCGRRVDGALWDEIKEKWNRMNARPQYAEVCSDSIFHIHTFRCKHAGDAAIETGTILEKNVSSLGNKHQYWSEFWNLLNEMLLEDESKKAFWIKGLDAHSVEELEKSYNTENL